MQITTDVPLTRLSVTTQKKLPGLRNVMTLTIDTVWAQSTVSMKIASGRICSHSFYAGRLPPVGDLLNRD